MALIDADARLRRADGRRPGDRGRVREHGRQAAGVPHARRGVQAGRDPGVQHLGAGPRHDRRLHPAPARRDRPALLQPGQRDAAARDRARRTRPRPTCWPPAWRWPRRSRRSRVVSGVCDGFIGNRMLATLRRRGQRPADARRAAAAGRQARCEKFGFAMGPFRMGDLAGLDIGWAGRKRRAAENPSAYQRGGGRCASASRAASARRPAPAGTATRPAARDPIPDPLVDEHHRRSSARSAASTPRKISDDEVVERCIFALVNEGARILDEKASPPAPATSTWSTSTATASRSTAAARCCTPTPSACPTWCAR